INRTEVDDLIQLYKAAAEAHLADDNPGRAASLFSNLAATFKQKKWSHPQLAEIEKKADELYNRSIQSKLEGISRGSVILDPAKLALSVGLAQGAPETATHVMHSTEEESSTSYLPPGAGLMAAGNVHASVDMPTTI